MNDFSGRVDVGKRKKKKKRLRDLCEPRPQQTKRGISARPGVFLPPEAIKAVEDISALAWAIPRASKPTMFSSRPPGPILEAEHTDARSVYERLKAAHRVKGEMEDVSPESFPTQDDVLAELRYSFDETEWAAVVTKDVEESGTPCFRLWYQRGNKFQRSGLFTDGLQLAKYIRQAAGEKFGGFRPVIDTLDKLKFKHAASVVPECYQTHARTAKCQQCPYDEECFDGITRADVDLGPVEKRVIEQYVEEPEAVFVRRLKGKVADHWPGEDE